MQFGTLFVVPNPNPPTVYAATQIKSRVSNTVFIAMDGSNLTVLNTVGNLLPNATDWVLIPRDALGTNEGGNGQPDPGVDLTATVVTNAAFLSGYAEYHGQAQNTTPVQV